MNKESLKYLRIIIPGILILILIIPLFQPKSSYLEIFNSINFTEGSAYIILAAILGAIYYLINIRKLFLQDSLSKIQENIKNKLLDPFKNDPIIKQHQDDLRKGRILLETFYKLIDNDESLKEKAKNVYLNGLIWTTIADISALSLFFCIIYFSIWLITTKDYLVLAGILFVIFILSSTLGMKKVTEIHIEKSNEQLDYIHIHLSKELKQLMSQVLKTSNK